MGTEQTPEETVYERNKRVGANTEGFPRERPEPGTGVVHVHEEYGGWQAVWLDDERGRTLFSPTPLSKAEALEWAHGLPATEVRVTEGRPLFSDDEWWS
jgi:hypothetical protein